MTEEEEKNLSLEKLSKAATLGSTSELLERVEDDLCPTVIRTEVSVIQFKRRIATLGEKIRRLETAVLEQQHETAELRRAVRDILHKISPAE